MDTSETYGVMCEKALPDVGWLEDNHTIYHRREHWRKRGDVRYVTRYTFTPLYRQDQLQDMIKDDAISLTQKFWGWIITDNYVPIGLSQPSMEQLWLAFTMAEKYNKVWNGRNWVKTK